MFAASRSITKQQFTTRSMSSTRAARFVPPSPVRVQRVRGTKRIKIPQGPSSASSGPPSSSPQAASAGASAGVSTSSLASAPLRPMPLSLIDAPVSAHRITHTQSLSSLARSAAPRSSRSAPLSTIATAVKSQSGSAQAVRIACTAVMALAIATELQ